MKNAKIGRVCDTCQEYKLFIDFRRRNNRICLKCKRAKSKAERKEKYAKHVLKIQTKSQKEEAKNLAEMQAARDKIKRDRLKEAGYSEDEIDDSDIDEFGGVRFSAWLPALLEGDITAIHFYKSIGCKIKQIQPIDDVLSVFLPVGWTYGRSPVSRRWVLLDAESKVIAGHYTYKNLAIEKYKNQP
jgi:hypothetical protein